MLPVCKSNAGGGQLLCGAGMASAAGNAPSALLRATTKVLHFAVARYDMAARSEEAFAAAVSRAMAAFANSLSDQMLMCACLGALNSAAEFYDNSCSQVLDAMERKGMYDAVFTTLQQVMQVKLSSVGVCS